MVFITVFELVSIERNFSVCTRRLRHMNGSSKTHGSRNGSGKRI